MEELNTTASAESNADIANSEFDSQEEVNEGLQQRQEHGDKNSEQEQGREEVKAEKAPNYEKMFKDTQAAYTQARQEVAALKAKAKALEEALENQKIELEPEVAEELERLKYSNPEAWRAKLNAIENSRAKDLDSKVAVEVERAKRQAELDEFNATNPDGIIINDYLVEEYVPAGLLKKLEKNEITFKTFLKEAAAKIKSAKVGPGSSPNAGKKDPMTHTAGSADPECNIKGEKEPDYADMIL